MQLRSRTFLLPVLPLLASTALAGAERREPPRETPTPEITAGEFLTRAAYLASDELAGRESGAEGGRLAEEYVAAEFARLGVEPLGDDGTLFQQVALPSRAADAENTWLERVGPDGERARKGTAGDVLPFGFSPNAEAEGDVVFAGFGLTDETQGYDDFAGVDVTGRVVLLLRHGPAEDAADSPWAMRRGAPGLRRNAQLLSFTAKAERAAKAGAAAVLVVNDYHHEEDELPVAVRADMAPVPVLGVRRAIAEELCAGVEGGLRGLQQAIDADRRPRSQALPGVRVRVRSASHTSSARNVVGVLRGSDPALADEAVVLGAHLDHVGLGRFGSAGGSAAAGKIHNGADDNASGTAALLEIVEWLRAQPAPPRSIVVAAWCGEEQGLVGSRSYCDAPLWPLAKTVACVNLDMVGRYRDAEAGDEGLMIEGAPTGAGLDALVARVEAASGLRTTRSWEAWEQSDHFAFYAKRVPALFLTTGLHPEYHRPEDDWWLLRGDGAARVAQLAARLVLEIASVAERPAFVERPPQPVLGVQLDDAPGGGVLLRFVYPDMGAHRAGLRPGDVLTEWDGAALANSGALRARLGTAQVGQTVRIAYVRDGARHEAELTLSGR